jgi:hypothetical protein
LHARLGLGDGDAGIAPPMLIQLGALAIAVAGMMIVWGIENRRRAVLSPFLTLMIFQFLLVFPAFEFAQELEASHDHYALVIWLIGDVGILIGFAVTYLSLGCSRDLPRRFMNREAKLERQTGDTFAVVILAALLIAVGFFLYGGLPATVKGLASVFKGTSGDLTALAVRNARQQLTKGAYFGGEYRGAGVMTSLEEVGWSLITAFFLLKFLERHSVLRLVVFLASVVAAWVFVAGTGTRGPFIQLLVCVAAAYSLRRSLHWHSLVGLFVFVCVVGIGMSIYSTKMQNLLALGPSQFAKKAVQIIFLRIVVGNGINDVYAIEYIRSGAMELQEGGIHLRDILAAIPGLGEKAPPLAYQLFVLEHPGTRTTVFATGSYISKVFVDFASLGVALIFPIVGAVVALMQRWIFGFRPTPWGLACISVLSIAIGNLVMTGPVGLGATMIVWLVLTGLFHLLTTLVGSSLLNPATRTYRPGSGSPGTIG